MGSEEAGQSKRGVIGEALAKRYPLLAQGPRFADVPPITFPQLPLA